MGARHLIEQLENARRNASAGTARFLAIALLECELGWSRIPAARPAHLEQEYLAIMASCGMPFAGGHPVSEAQQAALLGTLERLPAGEFAALHQRLQQFLDAAIEWAVREAQARPNSAD